MQAEKAGEHGWRDDFEQRDQRGGARTSEVRETSPAKPPEHPDGTAATHVVSPDGTPMQLTYVI